jgi:hypothetical protein
MVVFMIVGKADPLYEVEITPPINNSSAGGIIWIFILLISNKMALNI